MRQAEVLGISRSNGVLPAAAGVGGGPGVDAPHRRAAPGAPVCGRPDAARYAQAGRLRGGAQARGHADAAMGIAALYRKPQYQRRILRTGVSLSAEEPGDRPAEPGVGDGHLPTSRCAGASSTWWRSWTGRAAGCWRWRLSNSLTTDFCIEAVEEAIARLGVPEIFNTDQGSQFTARGSLKC